jgi:hypothetical protein
VLFCLADANKNFHFRGSSKKGVDLVNIPKTGLPSLEELDSKLPMEVEFNAALSFGRLVSVNNKTELLLYGGQINDKIFDGIYKFSPVTKLWMKVGKMIFPRAAHTVTPVQGITCP